MTRHPTPEDEWAGAHLRAVRTQAGLTQAQVAEKAGIDRSRYNALENGNYPISLTYAERIAAIKKLKISDPKTLLPQTPKEPPEESPLDRLAALEEQVAERLQLADAFAQELLERLAALEANQANAAQQPSPRESEPGG